MSPMAMPEVGLPNEPVPQTVTPRSLAASVSIEALRMPVVMRSFKSGSASITLRGKPVRSRMATDDLESLERGDDVIGPAEMRIEDLDVDVALDLRPVGDLEHHVLIIVENCAANRHDASTPLMSGGGSRACRQGKEGIRHSGAEPTGPARSGRPDDRLREEPGIHNHSRCKSCSDGGYGFRVRASRAPE